MAAGASVAALGPVACKAAPRATVSILDFLPAREHPRIAEGRSDYDCGPDLERAIAAAVVAGAVLELPKGLYQLAPRHRLAHADNFPCLAAVRMVSGMRLRGALGALLRVVPGYSTDKAPRAMAMFAASGPIADVEFENLTLDMNGRNNPISPGRVEGIYNRLPQAHIFVSGGRGQETARVDRASIRDCEFRDSNGVSCIVMGQTEEVDASLGQDWIIERCRFLDNGMDTDDHSSIYAYAEGVQTRHCTFSNTTPFGPTGVNTAYEVHGSRQTIYDCKFINMMRGIWIANNYSKLTTDIRISDNSFRTIFYGVDFFNDRSRAKPIRRTAIVRNQFAFDDNVIPSSPGLDFKAAIQIASEFGQQDVRISENRVRKTGHVVSSAFLVVTGGAIGDARHDAIVATDNQGSGLTFGSFVRTAPSAGIGRVTIIRSEWTNLAPSAKMAVAAGDVVEHTGVPQLIASLTLGGGGVQAADGNRVEPVYINGLVGSLVIDPIHTSDGTKTTKIALGGAGRVERVERRGASRH